MKNQKVWNLCRVFLKLEIAFCIVAIVVMVLGFGISTIISIVNGVNNSAGAFENFEALTNSSYSLDSYYDASDLVTQGGLVATSVYGIIKNFVSLVTSLPGKIVSLIFASKVLKEAPEVKTKKEAVKYGVFALVAGFFGVYFALVAGILILTRRSRSFEQTAEAPKYDDQEIVDAKVAE